MASSGTLNGRIALITGASSGIGEAIARDLAAQGARVIVNARRVDRLNALVADLNAAAGASCAVGVDGDASEDATITRMLDAAALFGASVDAVVVNAGRGLNGSVLTSDVAQWEGMIRTNLIGAAKLMREAAKRMSARLDAAAAGSWVRTPQDIVVIGSTVGRHISPFSSMYGSTKFAVHSLSEALRREIGPKGIRVTTVEPGIVRSEFQSVAGYDPNTFGAFMEKIGPVLEPADVARSVRFILEQPANVHMYDIALRPTRQDYP